MRRRIGAGVIGDLFDAAEGVARQEMVDQLLNKARLAVRRLVVENGWAPDVNSVPTYREGVVIGRAGAVLTTVAHTTLAAYEARGHSLLRKFGNEVLSLPEVKEEGGDYWDWAGPLDFAHWLAGMRPKIRPATWRVYKQSGLTALMAWPGPGSGIEEAVKFLEGCHWEKPAGAGRSKGKPSITQARTSATRTSRVALEDLVILFEYIELRLSSGASQRTDAVLLAVVEDWLIGGLATGLRPGEWRQSRLVFEGQGSIWPLAAGEENVALVTAESQDAYSVITEDWVPPEGAIYLVVHSEKHSNNRGNTPVRVLNLTSAPPEILRAVARMVYRGALLGENFAGLQRRAGDALYYAQGNIWPRRKAKMTFYSTRHQSLANWKAELGTLDAAVLAGHGIPDGPDRYYAEKKNAWDKKGKGGAGGGGGLKPGKLAKLLAMEPPGLNPKEKASLIAKSSEASMKRLEGFQGRKQPAPSLETSVSSNPDTGPGVG